MDEPAADPDERIEDLLDAYEAAGEAGTPVAPEALCGSYPELLPILRKRIAGLRAVAWLGTSAVPHPAAGAGERPPGPSVWQAGVEPVPGYRLVRPLGRGGCGEVWEAVGPGGLPVALKGVPLGGRSAASELRALDAVRGRRHPHLLALFGAWQTAGRLVVAAELADGSLADRLAEAVRAGLPGIPAAELLGYVREAAEGLDYLCGYPAGGDTPPGRGAPNSGATPNSGSPVAHRDVKTHIDATPHTHAISHIDATPNSGSTPNCGSTPNSGSRVAHRDVKPQNLLLVGGGVKVADFGLARAVGGGGTGHSGGMTVGFAPPEAFDGRTHRAGDQYSLAVTYCLLRGGRMPFAGPPAALMRAHLHDPPDLSMLPPAERPAVARALAKDPAARWPSCRAFVDALVAAADEHKPAGAGRPYRRGAGGPVSRRGALALGAAAATLGGLAAAGYRLVRPDDARPAGGVPVPPGLSDPPIVLRGHAGVAAAAAFVPGADLAVSGGFDGTVRLWYLAAGREVRVLGRHPGPVRCVAVSADGTRYAAGGGLDGRGLAVAVGDLAGRPAVAELAGHRHHVHGAAFLPGGRVATAGLDGTARVWDAATGAEVLRFAGLDRPDVSPAGWGRQVWGLAVSADGRRAVCGLRDGSVRAFDPATGEEVFRRAAHRGIAAAVAVTPDGRRAVSAAGGVYPAGEPPDLAVRVWDLEAGREVACFERAGDGVRAVAVLPAGDRAVLAGRGAAARVMDLRTGQGLRIPSGATDGWAVALDPAGGRVLTAGADGTLSVTLLPPTGATG